MAARKKKKSGGVKADQYEITLALDRKAGKTIKSASPSKRKKIRAVRKALSEVTPKSGFDDTPEKRKAFDERTKLREAVNTAKFGRRYPTRAQEREVKEKRKIAKGKAAVARVSRLNKEAVNKRKKTQRKK